MKCSCSQEEEPALDLVRRETSGQNPIQGKKSVWVAQSTVESFIIYFKTFHELFIFGNGFFWPLLLLLLLSLLRSRRFLAVPFSCFASVPVRRVDDGKVRNGPGILHRHHPVPEWCRHANTLAVSRQLHVTAKDYHRPFPG